MKIQEIADLVSAEIICDQSVCRDRDIEYSVAADLMSEVMVDTKDGSLVVTGLINPQVIRTAEMMNVFAVLFVRGKEIPEQILQLAEDREVTVLRTPLTMFETCGRLYEAGLRSGR